MKKILSTALAIGLVTGVGTSAYAVERDYSAKNTSVVALAAEAEKGEFLAGKIKGYENGKVKIEVLFNIDDRVDREKDVYIDVTEGSFEFEKYTEYPEGYLISIYYNEVEVSGDTVEIKANVISSVEEDAVATIYDQGGIEGEVTIMPIVDDGEAHIMPIDDEVNIMPIDDEVNIMPIDITEGKELFIGVIESKEGNTVKVKPIFTGGKDFVEDESVYLNIDGAVFENGEVKEYPEGYIMSIYYTEKNETEKGMEIKAEVVSAVEEDGVVTINDGENLNSQEESIKATENKVEEKHGFFQGIMNFFKNLFSAGK